MSVNCKHFRDENIPSGGVCAIGEAKRPSHGWCNKVCTKREPHACRDIILKNNQGAGDQVMLTAAVRDLQRSCPGRFRVAVDVWARELWENNPYITPREQMDPALEPIVTEGFEADDDQNNLIFCFHRVLGQRLNVTIKPGKIGGDIYLSDAEKAEAPKIEGDYWIAWFGGHMSFSTKWWNPAEAQRVVDHFKGRLTFVQVGQPEHWHEKLRGVVDMIGKTPMREMVKLMYHAQGGVGPISFGMHLAAAVPTKPGAALRRPYVVIAGGRESVPLIQYPTQTVLSNIGGLRCCQGGACWKNTSHSTGGRRLDCEQPVELRPGVQVFDKDGPGLRLAKCMTMITAEQVIAAIEKYQAGIADQRRYEARQRDIGDAVAAETLPHCVQCPSFVAQAPGRKVRCRQVEGCCGDEFGNVDLVNGQCVLTPPVWRAADTIAARHYQKLALPQLQEA